MANTTQFGPGLLYWAPFGTSVPTSVSSTLDPAFIPVGNTMDGTTFNYQLQTADLMIEESYFPTNVVPTGVTESLTFNLADYSANHLTAAFNLGFVASPSGNATITSPTLGTEAFLTIVWQDAVTGSNHERWIYRKCINTGSVAIQRRKAPNVTAIAFTMRIVDPLGGIYRWGVYTDSTINI